jgi:hypothetical protein
VASRSDLPSRVTSLEYVIEVAKGWALARFSAAEDSEFELPPHRFELHGTAIRRHPLPENEPEASSPLDAVPRVGRPTAWAHSAVVTVLADGEAGTSAFEQEVVEVLAMKDGEVLAEAAPVIRISGLPPCLGPFWSPE